MSDICKLISVTNQKGGAGKSTTALNLAAALSASGKRVLLVDNDPQGNLTAALGFTPAGVPWQICGWPLLTTQKIGCCI